MNPTLNTNTTTLRCQALRKEFNGTVAVDNVSFSLKRGDFLCLLGPSGCGKTTTLRLIAGFEKPDEGIISIAGRTVAGQDIFVRPEERKVGVVFQEYALFPHMTVEENIGYGIRNSRQRQQKVKELLKLVGLCGMEKRHIHELSGGQQQRVALARALAPEPDLILLDEPFSNLDANPRQQLRWELLDILKREGRTAVFVTHDQEEALALGDWIAVMEEGRILQFGSPEEVYERPINDKVASLVGEVNWIEAHVNKGRAYCILGQVPVASPVEGKVKLMVRPEQIEIDPHPEGHAFVAQKQFLGPTQLVMLTMGHNTIKVRVPSHKHIAIGSKVKVNFTRAPMAYKTP